MCMFGPLSCIPCMAQSGLSSYCSDSFRNLHCGIGCMRRKLALVQPPVSLSPAVVQHSI